MGQRRGQEIECPSLERLVLGLQAVHHDHLVLRSVDGVHLRAGWYPGTPGRGSAAVLEGLETLEGSFSAVSKPNFASKYVLESSRRHLQKALLCTVL